MTKVLITGATGFLGSHLSKRLLNEKYEVYGTIKPTDHLNNKANRKINYFKCDIGDFPSVLNVIKTIKPEIIIHLAAILPGENTDKALELAYYEINAKGTNNIFCAMRKAGVKKAIFSSTMNVYGEPLYLPVDENHPTEPINTYGLSKLIGEMFCKKYYDDGGINTIILRFSGIFGPGKNSGAIYNFINNALNNKPIRIYSDGSDLWDAIYIDDAIKAILAAEKLLNQAGFEIFNIGSGKGLNTLETAEKIIKLTGSKSSLMIEGKEEPIKFYFDTTKAKKLLNLKPTDLAVTLHKFIDYCRFSKTDLQ